MGSAATATALPSPLRRPEFPARDNEVLKHTHKNEKQKRTSRYSLSCKENTSAALFVIVVLRRILIVAEVIR